ncbi:type II toxin-antitoxin system RelE/ParE family toxin [Aggregatibacter actinomycetemcomitans]|uniref:type II toxin-antitoxin system RelE/ParE family toxin n=1 Tax=Aggregatibacter actinomycetemcomitans TaxID=714 RepID=UPI00197B9FE7|nr:type II toxin-antitoxin system RelE/ParE family toxin [Aggregatibacter actinomycetemcomitans]MBN6081034.1 type II toxin-antitoxin system RelE/ParE family toxin [Aggregatibacter actinomycetemcomitans]
MNLIETTEMFDDWLDRLKNLRAKIQIATRIRRAENGNFGDHKALPNTGGVSEMRIDIGKGYRIYYGQLGEITYILTNGGDKSTQSADIERAKQIFAQLKLQKKDTQHD